MGFELVTYRATYTPTIFRTKLTLGLYYKKFQMVYSVNSVCFRGSTFDAVVFHLEMCTISMVMASKLPQEKFFFKKKKKKKKKKKNVA